MVFSGAVRDKLSVAWEAKNEEPPLLFRGGQVAERMDESSLQPRGDAKTTASTGR